MERINNYMFVDFDDITFWASNIPKEVEHCINQVNEEVDRSFDTEDQRKAYHLGVDNTLSLLKQLLDEGTSKNSITFYCPSIDITEEMTADEVVELVSKFPEQV